LSGSDRLAGTKPARSAFIEDILRQCLRERPRSRNQARAIELLNRGAERLNRDAELVWKVRLETRGRWSFHHDEAASRMKP